MRWVDDVDDDDDIMLLWFEMVRYIYDIYIYMIYIYIYDIYKYNYIALLEWMFY